MDHLKLSNYLHQESDWSCREMGTRSSEDDSVCVLFSFLLAELSDKHNWNNIRTIHFLVTAEKDCSFIHCFGANE